MQAGTWRRALYGGRRLTTRLQQSPFQSSAPQSQFVSQNFNSTSQHCDARALTTSDALASYFNVPLSPIGLLHSPCVIHRSFATRVGAPRVRTDGSSVRRVVRRTAPTAHQLDDIRELDDDAAEDEEPDADEAQQNQALWKQISQRDHSVNSTAGSIGSRTVAPRVKQLDADSKFERAARGSSTQEEKDGDSSRDDNVTDSYKPYRPYSDPRSASVPPTSTSAHSSPPKPKYTSSRQTPAQLAWKKQQNNPQPSAVEGGDSAEANSGNHETESEEITGRRQLSESKDAAARSRFAMRHQLGKHSPSRASTAAPTTPPPASPSISANSSEAPLAYPREYKSDSLSSPQSLSPIPNSTSSSMPSAWGAGIGNWTSSADDSSSSSSSRRINMGSRREVDEDEEDVDDRYTLRSPTARSRDRMNATKSRGGKRGFETQRNHEGFQERVGITRGRDSASNGRRAAPATDGWGSGVSGIRSSRGVRDESSAAGSSSSLRSSSSMRDDSAEPSEQQPSQRESSDYWRDRPPSMRSPPSIPSSSSSFSRSNYGGRSERDSYAPRRMSGRSNDSFNSSSSFGRSSSSFERSSSSNFGSTRIQNVRGELLYGFHPVLCALQSGKRTFYHLYLQENKADKDTGAEASDKQLAQVLALARTHDISVSYMPKHEMNLKADNRPHNGFLLDASPLEIELVHSPHEFQALQMKKQQAAAAASEDAQPPSPKKPELWLLLDEIMDPQNLGAMLRSSFYFHVSGVLLCQKNSAPLSVTSSKASSGAQELIQIVGVGSTARFLHKLPREQWNVIGMSLHSKSVDLRTLGDTLRKERTAAAEDKTNNAVKHTLLVVGNEGRGLRPIVQESCDILAKIVGTPLEPIPEEEEEAATDMNEITEASESSEPVGAAAEENADGLEKGEQNVSQDLQDRAQQLNQEEESQLASTRSPSASPTPLATELLKNAKTKRAQQMFKSKNQFVDSLNVSNALAVALYELGR